VSVCVLRGPPFCLHISSSSRWIANGIAHSKGPQPLTPNFIFKSQHREGLERCRLCPFRVAARKAKGQATPPCPVAYVSQCPAPPSRHLAPLPSASPSQAPRNLGNLGHPSQAPQRRISFFLLFPLSAKLPARKFCPAGGLLRLCSLHGRWWCGVWLGWGG
jgi:hypothetical protein